jgi:hypothetical protein
LARGCESGSGGLILKILKPRLYDFTVPRSERSSDSAVAAAPIVLEATAGVSDDVGELPDGDAEDSPPDAPCLTRR